MGKLSIISSEPVFFNDRIEAGAMLAGELGRFKGKDTIVVGIPRGGMIIASQISKILGVDLDIVLSHKIGAPQNPEFAIGAVSEDGAVVLDDGTIKYLELTVDLETEKKWNSDDLMQNYIKNEGSRQLKLMKNKIAMYRKILPKKQLKDKTVILTDDGIATGSTVRASLNTIRNEKPKKLILAVPVAPKETVRELSALCDELICLSTPDYFNAVGQFYRNFEQTSDEDVAEILHAQK